MAYYRETREANTRDLFLALAVGIGVGLLVHKSFDAIGWQGNFFGDVGNIGISSWLGLASLGGSYSFLSTAEKLPKDTISANQRYVLRRTSLAGFFYGVSSAALSYIGMHSINAMPDVMNIVAAGGLGVVNAYGYRKFAYVGNK